MEAAGGPRRRGQRILYYFRTPPAVRVGREALDDEARRLLEEHNPDVSFDWARLKTSSPPPSGFPGPAGGPAGPGGGPRDERRRERRERRPRSGSRLGGGGQGGAAPSERAAPIVQTDLEIEDREPESLDAGDDEPSRTLEELARVEAEEPSDAAEAAAPEEPAPPVPERYARIGADGVRRLRARYRDIADRLAARDIEEADRAVLLTHAERLNPDAWLTEAEVNTALEEYEAVFEALRPVVGRQPRRRQP